MITGEQIEAAERAITTVYQIAVGPEPQERVLAAARTDPMAFDRFAAHHKEILFKTYLPDVDPRNEPAIMTMLLHFYAVGAVAQQLAERGPS